MSTTRNATGAAGWGVAGILLFLMWPAFAVWRGYAIAKLWGWFIVPTFGLPAISIYSAVGLVLVIGSLKAIVYEHDERSAAERFWWHLCIAVLGPALMIAIGWTWKWLQWGIA